MTLQQAIEQVQELKESKSYKKQRWALDQWVDILSDLQEMPLSQEETMAITAELDLRITALRTAATGAEIKKHFRSFLKKLDQRHKIKNTDVYEGLAFCTTLLTCFIIGFSMIFGLLVAFLAIYGTRLYFRSNYRTVSYGPYSFW